MGSKILLALLLSGLFVSAALAQEPEPAPAVVKPLPELRSPRATVHTFLRAMRDKETELAISCLDLGKLTKEATATSGLNVVYQLHVVIKRLTKITLDDEWPRKELPDENEDSTQFSLEGITGSLPKAADLILRRNKDDANWRFSQATCDGIATLYNALEQASEPTTAQQISIAEEIEEIEKPFAIRLRDLFPNFLLNKTFLLPDYQWICLLTLIFFGLAADILTRWFLSLISSRWLENYIEEEERHLVLGH